MLSRWSGIADAAHGADPSCGTIVGPPCISWWNIAMPSACTASAMRARPSMTASDVLSRKPGELQWTWADSANDRATPLRARMTWYSSRSSVTVPRLRPEPCAERTIRLRNRTFFSCNGSSKGARSASAVPGKVVFMRASG